MDLEGGMMSRDEGGRKGRVIVLRDADGRRHAIRPGAIQAASEGDDGGMTTILTLPGGRMLIIDEPLDEVIDWM